MIVTLSLIINNGNNNKLQLSEICYRYLFWHKGSFLLLSNSLWFGFSGGNKTIDTSGYPRDKVVLFQFFRGAWAPSVSPFPIKLETYLRFAGIPYIVSVQHISIHLYKYIHSQTKHYDIHSATYIHCSKHHSQHADCYIFTYLRHHFCCEL